MIKSTDLSALIGEYDCTWEWCRRPQEAHIAEGVKYRRLSVEEIAVIQGFDPAWVDVEGLSELDRISSR